MNKKIKQLITLTIILVLGLSILSGCSDTKTEAEDSFAIIEDRGYVVVGLDDTFAPMGFKDEKGTIVGFDVDLAKEVFKRIGLEVKFQPIDWAMKETELNSKNIDMIWNGYTITDARKEKVAFTKAYLENSQVIVTLADSDIKTKADLKNKTVATQSGSSSLDAINAEAEVAASFKDGEPVLFETYNEAFMDLEAGRSDAVVADEILARYYINARGTEKYKVLDEDFGDEEYGIGIRKQDKELLQKVEDALEDMRNDGTAAGISNKWFGEDIVK